MIDSWFLPALLAVGQFVGAGMPAAPVPAPPGVAAAPRVSGVPLPDIGSAPSELPPRRSGLQPSPAVVPDAPAAQPEAAPAIRLPPPPEDTEARPAEKADTAKAADRPDDPRPAEPKADDAGKPVEMVAPLFAEVKPKPAEAAKPVVAAVVADRWALMKCLQGTMYGAALDDNRLYLYGWINGSANASTARDSNSPITWLDRPDNFLLQQAWVRFGRSVVTTGTTQPTVGFQLDFLFGTDYRYTLPRGLWNSQLKNSSWDSTGDPYGTYKQHLYGVDLVQQYVNVYVPEWFQGTEIRAGRMYCPWGVESIEAVSTPLISHSYAFNWAPPFTHCGVGAYITFSPEWAAVLMVGNGNDVYWGDPSEEWRFMGNLKWTQPGGGKNTVTLATSVGRGKFNAGEPFAVPGVELVNEPFGRPNMNVFDIVWTHLFNSRLAYNLEGIFGYQTNVEGLPTQAAPGTATWASLAHYLFWTISPELTGILRYENFDDFQGQRTAVEALYSSFTAGLAYKPRKDVILRSELRYDIANHHKPFDNGTKNQLLMGAVDLIIRW